MRRFVQPVIAAVLAMLAVAAQASAAAHRHAPWRNPVRLVPLPNGGTSIHLSGTDVRPTVVLSADPIATAAVRDVDADGDLDIIASSGHGLVVWRNLGTGGYALATPPATRKLHRRTAPGLAPAGQSTEGSGLGEQRQQIAAADSTPTTRVVPATPPAAPVRTVLRSPISRTHAGRAPPLRP